MDGERARLGSRHGHGRQSLWVSLSQRRWRRILAQAVAGVRRGVVDPVGDPILREARLTIEDEGRIRMRRRDFLQVAVAGGLGAGLGVPAYLRRAWAQTPIKIGMPAALSGPYAQYGIQAKRAAELFSKDIKAKGVLGRPVEFIYEDTGGDPAAAVRKAQKLVEKDGVKFLTGVALSSEALAVSAKCPEWKVIFMSTINGAGALTAKAFHRYFFRVNTSGPMGARAISLYLAEGPMKRFFALGSDYAWGRDSVASFTQQITA